MKRKKIKNHLILFSLSLTLALQISCGSSGGGGADNAFESAPLAEPGPNVVTGVRAIWLENMLSFGRKHCNKELIDSLSLWEGSVWYYDGLRVYYQISDYTRDKSFERCADYIFDLYGKYVLDNAGKIPAWRVFPQGLAENFLRTGSEEARQAAILLSTDSPFAESSGGEGFELSRETAYLIHAYMTAADLGAPRSGQLEQSVNFALSHLRQWSSGEASYVKPFMLALTMEALIRYYESNQASAIPSAVKLAADWLWENAWDRQSRAFQYIVCRDSGASDECQGPDARPAADLNLLIAPAFAWLDLRFPDSQYDQKADQIFESGVQAAYLDNGKQFSQNYRWSFDYLKWRGF